MNKPSSNLFNTLHIAPNVTTICSHETEEHRNIIFLYAFLIRWLRYISNSKRRTLHLTPFNLNYSTQASVSEGVQRKHQDSDGLTPRQTST